MTPSKEPFTINLPVLFETILHLLSKGKPLDRFDISKMVYFGDRKHLFDYGKPITGDSFFAMDNGPVPTKTYDILKVASGEENNFVASDIQKMAFDVVGCQPDGDMYFPKRDPNLDYLSPSAVECLDWAFDHVYGKPFEAISNETHKHSGYKNLSRNSMMSFWDIIKDAENHSDLKEYLEDALDGSRH